MAIGREAFKRSKAKIELRPFLDSGQEIAYRKMSPKELKQLRSSYGDGGLDFVLAVLATTVCNDDGEPLFESAQDVEDTFELALDDLEALAKQALAVSGIGAETKN